MENPHIPDLILGSWLFLGSRHVRERKDVLDEHQIRVVLDFSQLSDLAKFEGIEYHTYDVTDNENSDIANFFEDCHAIMRKCFADNIGIFVHCNQGRSRSASIILSYLIKYESMTLKQAWNHVKDRRRIIMPNSGFWKQLIQYETLLHGSPTLSVGKYGQLYWVQ